MSTNVITLVDWEKDTPWRRLYWTFPAAIAIWVVILWSFAVFMGNSSERIPEPPAIDAQLIEITEPTKSAQTKPIDQSRPIPLPQVSTPQFIPEKITPPSPVEKPVVAQSMMPAPNVAKELVATSQQEPTKTTNTVSQNFSAKAIYQPIPQIPDELRQDALSAAAVARFHVAIDGTTTVELIKPTPNPKLNRLLLSTLKNWKFFPSMKDGKPKASDEEIVIKIEVK
jgi:protein TonB